MSPRPHIWRLVKGVSLVLVLAAAGVTTAQAASAPEIDLGGRRLIAVGDIHGAFNGVREILRKVELIDQKDRWVGGDAVLVQTGDFLDRGPGATKVARLLMDLQKEAPKHGGKVIVLLGNHEVLNLLGDLRDVTKYILRHHVDGNSEKRLSASCNHYARYYRRLYEQRQEEPPKRRELIERCLAEQQPGLVEYLEEVGPSGDVGRWIRKLPAVVRVDGVVFVHGGFNGELAGRDLDEINREVKRELQSYDRVRRFLLEQEWILPTSGLPEIVTTARRLAEATAGNRSQPQLVSDLTQMLQFQDWLTIREDGPMWFRGYSRWSEEEGLVEMPAILESLDAEHVIVGHTPQPPFRIRNRFASGVFLIDTGMLTSFYKGHPSALEIQDGSFTAFYLTKQDLLYQQRTVAAAP